MNITTLISKACGECYAVKNSREIEFNAVMPISEAGANDITWIKPGFKNSFHLIEDTKAGCLICNMEAYNLATTLGKKMIFVVSETPEIIFSELLQYLGKKMNAEQSGIHPTAIINNSTLGKNVSVGAYSIIDDAVIGNNCSIGDHVRIFGNVEIGENCRIREFCSIGGQGFNFIKNLKSNYIHTPHLGKVIIEEGVEIFPFSNVDRATLAVTRIGKGTKIDHYCHIGHNSRVGSDCLITAQTVLCGGVEIGNNCFLGVNSLIRNNLKIGKGVTVGMGATVLKDIPDNEIWFGSPAIKKTNNS